MSAALKDERPEGEGEGEGEAESDSADVRDDVRDAHRSGEHLIGLDAMIRRSFERAYVSELQSTSRLSPFVLEDMLARPEVRPSHPPAPAPAAVPANDRQNEVMEEVLDAIVNARPSEAAEAIVRAKFDLETEAGDAPEPEAAVAIGSLPPPAIEIDRTNEEERDP